MPKYNYYFVDEEGRPIMGSAPSKPINIHKHSIQDHVDFELAEYNKNNENNAIKAIIQQVGK